MARPPRFPDENRPHFVRTATAGRLPIFEHQGSAETMREVLYETRTEYSFLLLGYVIMPDHFHAVIVPAFGNTISQVMRFIKGRYARMHNLNYGSEGAAWQASFYDRSVRIERALRDILTYIFHNPVRAGLVTSPEEYAYSSASDDSETDLDLYLGGQAECLTTEKIDSPRK